MLGAAACFFVAFLTLPFLALRPAKFALAFRCAKGLICDVVAANMILASEACLSCLGASAQRLISALNSCNFSFAVLIGPINHIKHLLSKERLPFTVAYLASLGLTLYFSVGVRVSYHSYLSGFRPYLSFV